MPNETRLSAFCASLERFPGSPFLPKGEEKLPKSAKKCFFLIPKQQEFGGVQQIFEQFTTGTLAEILPECERDGDGDGDGDVCSRSAPENCE
jgi:hypothetical protein